MSKIDVRLNVRRIAEEGFAEVDRQLAKWGVQSHPTFPAGAVNRGPHTFDLPTANDAREIVEWAAERGDLTYTDIFVEKLCEALEAAGEHGEGSDQHRTELIQCLAVLMSWIDSLDRRYRSDA